ncbi:MAG: DUF3747 domain-containing protein [Microcoleaceae cyanobacterium MO_207.B10]|nr:DUF3747 domain-containing protein [Microcoleaceae cyanobacterium MO_207.B10]
MKKFIQGSIATFFTTIFFTINLVPLAQANPTFERVEMDKNQVILTAIPLSKLEGDSSYKLMILEQNTDGNSCWSETETAIYPILVAPLATNSNFSDICRRATDSNSYSIRVDNNDLSQNYKLTLKNIGDDIHLVAISRSEDKILIGRTRGLADGMMKILLEPGWQFTKQSYEGEVLARLNFSYESFAAQQAAVEQKIAALNGQILENVDVYDNQYFSKKYFGSYLN